MIPQHYIDDLLARVEIVSLIDHRVKLKKMGKNHMACCPFHDEKSPSFSVNEAGQFFYCFGCGASGNGIGFVMRYDNLSFVEAVKKLAMAHGMSEHDKATKAEMITAEEKRLQQELMDERLLVEIGNSMIGRGEFMPREDVERHELAKKKVLQIKNAIFKLRN